MTELTPDLAARLSRRLMMRAWQVLRVPQIAVMGVVALVWIVFSIWAVLNRLSAEGPFPAWPVLLSDLAYAPLTFLVPGLDVASGAEIGWQAHIARFAGPLLPVLAIIWVARQHLLEAAARQLFRHLARGHCLIIAEGGSGDHLAMASSGEGHCVALIDLSTTGDEARLGEAGVITLSSASGSIAEVAKKAGSVIVWGGSDTTSLTRAMNLKSGTDGVAGDIYVRISAAATQRALRYSPGAGSVRLRPVSLEGIAVRQALCNISLVEQASERGHSHVSVCLWGGGSALPWAAELVLRHNWSKGLGAPQIHLMSGRSSIVWDEVVDAMSGLLDHWPELFGKGAGKPVQMHSDRQQVLHDGVTRHLVDMGSDDATISQAFRLAEDLRQMSETPPAVQAVLRSSSASGVMFTNKGLNFAPPIILRKPHLLEQIMGRTQDEAAAKLHQAYAESHGGEGLPASGRWQEIAETYVQANRAAADHMAVKQWDAGHNEDSVEMLVEALAEVEHRRWCAERLLDGWIPGQRDNDRRLHPNLVPWSRLSEADKDKDREQVHQALTTD